MVNLRNCCSYFCTILALAAAFIFSPLLFYRPAVVKIDDVKSWGLKGPYAKTLPKRMLGVYYLDGNQAPWSESDKCTAQEAKNNTICRNGFKRSQLNLMDTSYFHFDREAGTITQPGESLGISEFSEHKGGLAFAYLMALLRQSYLFEKDDADFVGRSPDALEGRMSLYVYGGLLKVASYMRKYGAEYRVTAEDNSGDGSVIERYTWIGGKWPDYEGWPYDKPAPKSAQFKEYKYTLRRLMDADGRVDARVAADYKKVYGENVVVLFGA